MAPRARCPRRGWSETPGKNEGEHGGRAVGGKDKLASTRLLSFSLPRLVPFGQNCISRPSLRDKRCAGAGKRACGCRQGRRGSAEHQPVTQGSRRGPEGTPSQNLFGRENCRPPQPLMSREPHPDTRHLHSLSPTLTCKLVGPAARSVFLFLFSNLFLNSHPRIFFY